MLISPNTVKNYGALNINVDDALLGNSIRVAQNVYLKDIVGNDLVEKLQELVFNKIQNVEDNIDSESNEQYKELLDQYIEPILVYKTIVVAATQISFKLRNAGLVKNSDSNITPVTFTEMIYYRDINETYFNDYCNKLVDYLCANSSAFPESNYDCKCGDHPRYANTNLYLGE